MDICKKAARGRRLIAAASARMCILDKYTLKSKVAIQKLPVNLSALGVPQRINVTLQPNFRISFAIRSSPLVRYPKHRWDQFRVELSERNLKRVPMGD